MKPSFGLFVVAALTLAIDLTPKAVAAQEGAEAAKSDARTARNVLYVELGGNALAYSVNYERFVTPDMDIRLGFEFFSFSGSATQPDGTKENVSASVLFLPLMFNYLGVGSADHKLELGIGPLLVYASGSSDGLAGQFEGDGFGVYGTATIGYRYVPHDGGFNFKVGFTPVFGKGGFLPWGGIGFGAVF